MAFENKWNLGIIWITLINLDFLKKRFARKNVLLSHVEKLLPKRFVEYLIWDSVIHLIHDALCRSIKFSWRRVFNYRIKKSWVRLKFGFFELYYHLFLVLNWYEFGLDVWDIDFLVPFSLLIFIGIDFERNIRLLYSIIQLLLLFNKKISQVIKLKIFSHNWSLNEVLCEIDTYALIFLFQ